MDFSVDPPTRFVLVQWVGLPPEDSTWEKWDDVCHAHHLEDKVSFTGSDDVSSSNTTKEDSSHDEPGKEFEIAVQLYCIELNRQYIK